MAPVLALMTGAWACGSSEEEGPSVAGRSPALDSVSLKSQRDGTSHEAGANCMACHGPNGTAPGLFTVAGTAFASPEGPPLSDAVVTLSTAPNGGGTVVLTLEADASGNFYTTETMPFPEQSLFPRLTRRTSTAFNFMSFPTMSGACNSCHAGNNPVDLE
ncbi:hypothetical protein HPC49_43995 [Pyxidicoccus fallax]|uniref:Uncharacterized protein n=1 Tax=Pyxidicoccus fallax TaxID=394095 RepID=A0A848LXR6_9BACT|nr:hypothetical protein [Pyxidicoccus fallax]NMO22865.1 hypothetical protein [Pyxidicoccus fallax]NPC85147.1 hypothetical protein [Pyxidicoccus fallax]